MNGNIANGGLVVKSRGRVCFAGTDEWFLNTDGVYIYYSDRADRNRLYRRRHTPDSREKVLSDPCSGLRLFGDHLYYINETDMKVYRCVKNGCDKTLCSDDITSEFGVFEDGGLFINPAARRLCVSGSKVVFADAANNFALTIIDTAAGEKEVVSEVKPSYINIHSENIYYTDRMKGNKIFRLNQRGDRLSIYGGSAECLHIIDDWLYFISNYRWKRLSLLNYGVAEAV